MVCEHSGEPYREEAFQNIEQQHNYARPHAQSALNIRRSDISASHRPDILAGR
jgi:hypothetical protein